MSGSIAHAHFSQAPFAIIGLSADRRVTTWDGAAEQIFGWSAADVLDKHIAELNLIYDEDIAKVEEVIASLISRRERTLVSLNRNWTKDRRVRYCEWHNTVATQEEANTVSVLSFVIDRTEQALAEERLTASRTRFRVLANASLHLASSLEYEQTLATVARLVVDSGLADSCALTIATESGELERVALVHRDPRMQPVIDVLQRYPPRATASFALRAYRERRTFVSESIADATVQAMAEDEIHLVALRELGSRTSVAVPLLNGDRALGALVLAASRPEFQYETETVALVEELARRCAAAIEHARLFAEERRLRVEKENVVRRVTLLQNISNGLSNAVTVKDAAELALKLVVPHLNGVAGAVLLRQGTDTTTIATLGYAPNALQRWEALASRARSAAAAVMESGTAVFFSDYTAYSKHYPEIATAVTPTANHAIAVVPLRSQGGVLGALVIRFAEPRNFTDDDKRLLESVAEQCAQALARAQAFDLERAAREEAAQANRAKDEFLAILGHELRNPLAPIGTVTHLLRMRGANPKEVAILQRQVDHLKRLVDDLLDISRITRGVFELRRAPIDIRDVLETAVEGFHSVLHDRRQQLTVEFAQEPLMVSGDRERLLQVFSNLLSNAAKYTEAGGRVAVTACKVDAGVEITVSDTGVGLPQELVGHVFDMFVQAPQAADRARGGLGLGLAIVKRLVEMHGGCVEAHSEGTGKGSCFRVVLPSSMADVASHGLALEPAGRIQSDIRVLVVDDNEDAATTLSELLIDRGYDVRVARDAPSALEVVSAFVPHVALLDIGLPVVDGHQLGGMLRERFGRIALVAVSGYASSRDFDLSRSAGFDAHLAKPVDPDYLFRELQRVVDMTLRTSAASVPDTD